MINNLAKALQDIPNLALFVDELLEISDDMTQQAKFDGNDHLALMSLCFVSKQIEHLRSIRILVDVKQYRDAGLIARSMIEGLCILLWAAHKPQIRPLHWKAYAWVEDYKLMLKKEKAGEEVDPAYKSRIIEQLGTYGSEFLTPKAKKKQENHLPLPRDPYRNRWIYQNVYEICKEVEGDLLYEKIYRETSQWIHWTIKGMSSAIHQKDMNFAYTNASADMGATALASGFQSLLESAKLLDSHLTLGFGDKLDNILARYTKFHRNRASSNATR
ncbi:MAG: DUF5677 domain-containing protein [Methanothrix sp.]|nr:DUF5677 domain-containing protein [Methanothrix sp.]